MDLSKVYDSSVGRGSSVRRRRGTARDAERPKAVGHERCGLEAETVGGREAGRGGVLGDGRRPEIDFTAGYCSTRESASRKMRVTPTLRFARALRDDTEPSSAYTATIWWLFAFVGLANWFFVFCLFVQVPVLIAVKDPGLGGSDGHHHTGGLPEGIRLSSFLNVFQQLGNGIALGMMFSLRASAIPTFGTLLLLAAVAASATMAALLPCANDLSVNEAGCDNGFIVRAGLGTPAQRRRVVRGVRVRDNRQQR